MNRIVHRIAVLGCLLLFSGCLSTAPQGDVSPNSPVGKARAMLDRGDSTKAMIECIDLAKKDPDMPGLKALQDDVVKALNEQRQKENESRVRNTSRIMGLDADAQKVVPYTYGMRRQVTGETGSLRTPSSDMEALLRKRITVHLDNVDLTQFILAIGAAENINMITDGSLAGTPPGAAGGAAAPSGKTMTLHAADTPLIEILNYVSRNLNVAFSVGDRILWVTPRKANATEVPMETRMYRLRKAISGDEEANAEDGIDIVRTIKRFVPDESGSDLMFNRKAHLLIVRNTRDNLALVEDVIEALDVCPPQVLIEARFITTDLNDLGELGIDWVLNSAIAVTEKGGANETEIATGAKAGFVGFDNAAQGLNFSYQGILTDPLFKATLHALEMSGKSRTLSVPRITTVNNRQARIRIGKDFRYFEQYDVQSIPSTTDDGQTIYRSVLVPVGTPTLEELGIELDVTPSVGADMGSVTLSMKPKITDFIRYEYYETAGTGGNTVNNSTNGTTGMVKVPIFSRSELETEVIVQSGQTVVMGGLITTSETRSESGIPVISRIPLIGVLFRRDSVTELKQNLLIFVTATILSEWGESLIPVSSLSKIESPERTAPWQLP